MTACVRKMEADIQTSLEPDIYSKGWLAPERSCPLLPKPFNTVMSEMQWERRTVDSLHFHIVWGAETVCAYRSDAGNGTIPLYVKKGTFCLNCTFTEK